MWNSHFYSSSLNYKRCSKYTSSTSTRDTSGNTSAPPFFLLFFAFPPPCSSPATTSRNLFWLWDFWDLRVKSDISFYSEHPLVSKCDSSLYSISFSTHLSHSVSSGIQPDSADSDGDMFQHAKAAADVLFNAISECHFLLFSNMSLSAIIHTVVHVRTRSHLSSLPSPPNQSVLYYQTL